MNLVLLIVLVLLLCGGGYGYRNGAFAGTPLLANGSGIIGLLLLLLVVFLLLRLLGLV